MIALTKEKREELIADCELDIKNLLGIIERFPEEKALHSVLFRQKIALASLTAEPVEYLTWHQGCRAPDDCEEYVVVADKGDKSCDGSDAFPVFATPPVPEIKLPDEYKDYGNNLTDSESGYNDCLAEIKRLNGLE